MNIVTGTLATGYATTWAGKTGVRASEAGVREVWLPDWHGAEPPTGSAEPVVIVEHSDNGRAEDHLRQALRELAEYFMGERQVFSVALDPQGPAFFRDIWAAVASVPYGETRAYGEIARALGVPDAARAVGAANGANPVAPFVPCHRIVGSDGRLTGYGPGLPLKQRLLIMEGALPGEASDYDAWLARVAERLHVRPEVLLIGVRATGTYCRPDCARARRSLRPNRVFRDAAEARAAGLRACERCQSDHVVGLWDEVSA
jgi:methylated-DNA-[protein]-cysteine S-methyltransferase